MAKKVKRKIPGKPVKRNVAKEAVQTRRLVSKSRARLALRDLILFAVLSLIFYILYSVTGDTKLIYQDTFFLLSIVLGFIALAFLIIFLVIIFSREKIKSKR